MPKHFDLKIRVEEAALGRIMNVLKTTPGVVKFDFLDMDDAPRTAKQNGAAEPHEKKKTRKTRFVDPTGATGTDLLMKLLSKAKEPMRQSALREAFTAAGRGASSSGSIIHLLSKEGVVQNKGDGYTLTKKGRDRARYVK